MADETVDKDVEEGKSLAWLSYIWLLFLVPLLAKKDNKFCKFHAKQGLVLFIAEIIVSIINIIPILGQIIWLLCALCFLIIAIMGIVQSLGGKYWKMPVLGGFAEKFNF
jgi:uncharacterized membrane protein